MNSLTDIKYRGILVCQNSECDEYGKSVFALLTPKERPQIRYCQGHIFERIAGRRDATTYRICHQQQELILEDEFYTLGTKLFRQVRIEYQYDTISRTFRDLVVLTDEALPESAGIYTLRSPLIRTDKRAVKVAENILSNLMLRYVAENVRLSQETVLSFDEPLEILSSKCQQWGSQLAQSQLALNAA